MQQLQRMSEAAWIGLLNLSWIWFTIGLSLGMIRIKQLCESGVFFQMMGQPPIGMPLGFQRLAQMVSLSMYVLSYVVAWPLDYYHGGGPTHRH